MEFRPIDSHDDCDIGHSERRLLQAFYIHYVISSSTQPYNVNVVIASLQMKTLKDERGKVTCPRSHSQELEAASQC